MVEYHILLRGVLEEVLRLLLQSHHLNHQVDLEERDLVSPLLPHLPL